MEGQMMGQNLSGMTSPDLIQQQLNELSADEIAMAKQSLAEIRAVIEELLAAGASEEEIMQILADIGITLEQLEFAERILAQADQATGMMV
tara:strand:+ start:930 stop:1202 length:273 start_codon:yes stop_codon:yes gene_type:complete